MHRILIRKLNEVKNDQFLPTEPDIVVAQYMKNNNQGVSHSSIAVQLNGITINDESEYLRVCFRFTAIVEGYSNPVTWTYFTTGKIGSNYASANFPKYYFDKLVLMEIQADLHELEILQVETPYDDED